MRSPPMRRRKVSKHPLRKKVGAIEVMAPKREVGLFQPTVKRW